MQKSRPASGLAGFIARRAECQASGGLTTGWALALFPPTMPHRLRSTAVRIYSPLRCFIFILFLTLCGVARAQSNPPVWLQAERGGDIVYFTFDSPARIERYDLSQEKWLTTISLPAIPAAFHVDTDGLYLAFGREVVKRALDGTNEQPVYNTPGTVNAIVTDSSYIFVSSAGPRLDSIRKADSQFIGTYSNTNYYSLPTSGFVISSNQRKIYGSDSYSTYEISYNSDGTFVPTISSFTNYNYYYYSSRNWLAPDQRLLINTSGTAFSVPNVVMRSYLGASIDALAFNGTDMLIALRGNKLVAFDNTLTDCGSCALANTAKEVAVRAGQVYAFRIDTTQTPVVAVEKTAVSNVTAVQPGNVRDPAQLTFVPDDVAQVEDGTLLLLSKSLQSIFRWSPATRTYTATYSLVGTPTSFAYSTTLHRIYTAYASGAILQISLDALSPAETAYTTLSSYPATSLQPMDELLLVNNSNNYLNIYDRNGTLTTGSQNVYYSSSSNNFAWSSALRRFYETGYSSITYIPIALGNQFGTGVSGTYLPNTSYVSPPLRLDSSSTTLASGNGYIYRATDLSYLGALSNAVSDLVWWNSRWASIRSSNPDTQLQTWTNSYFQDKSFSVPGVPMRIFSMPDGRLAVITTSGGDPTYPYGSSGRNTGRLYFSVVDTSGGGTVASAPRLTTDLANTTLYTNLAGSLTVAAQGTGLTYQWRKNGSAISGATGATLSFSAIKSSDTGSYSVVVGNSYGTTTSATAEVTVQDPPAAPVITTQPQPTYLNPTYTSSSLYVYASGTVLTYQWRKNGTPISGATSSQYYFYNPTTADLGNYDVIVSNPGGSVTSNQVAVAFATSPTIVTQPVGQTVSVGGTASFTVAAAGAPAPTFQWQRQAAGTTGFYNLGNGAPYFGTNSATLQIFGATVTMNGDQFRCVAANSYGYGASATSNAATLTVTNAPAFASAASATFIAGRPNSFVVKALGTPAPTFTATGLPTWAGLDPVSGILSGTPPSTGGAPFLITITASNGTQPDAIQTLNLNVQAAAGAPAITTPPLSQSVGAGANVTFSVVASGAATLTYQWKKDTIAISGATNTTLALSAVTTSDAGRYTVTVTNAAGTATSTPAQLSVVPVTVTAVHTLVGPGYVPGTSVTISNTLTFTGTASGIGWQVLIPNGWTYVSGGGTEGDVKPAVGTSSLLEWAWSSSQTSPLTFSYTLSVPASQTGQVDLDALVILRNGGDPIQLLANPDPLVLQRTTTHSADTDGDGKISLFELTRVIELYNTRNGSTRTGAYKVDATGEDGFNPDATRAAGSSAVLAAYHSTDEDHNGRIDLLELTRLIELYNYRNGSTRTGQYHIDPAGEDGFNPGP